MTRRLITALPLLTALALPATARADGLPVIGYESNNTSIVSPDGADRYVTHVQGHFTRLTRRSAGGALIVQARIPGPLVVPVVAYDGTSAGLAHDGRTLVLIRPRVSFPQASTHLAIVDPATLAVRRRIELRGDFSFDAISPDGRWVYVIQYTSRSDPTRYRVRALDAPTGTLLPGSIVDPRDRGEAMHGNPLTRATSADGSLAFTLYDGNGHPFVHALDTATGTARCIDVPQFPATFDPFTSRFVFASGQSRLLVRLGTRTLATIDTGRLVVVRPHPAATAAKVSGSAPPSDAPIIAVLAAVGLLAAGYGARRVISHRPPAAEV